MKSKHKSKSKPKPKPKHEDGAASDKTVKKQIARQIASRCSASGPGQRVQVRFTILSSGAPSMARAKPPHRDTALGKCAVKVVAAHKFAPGKLRPVTVTAQL